MRAKPPAPSDLADKFQLRLPEGMRERIAASARESGRSMNSEIVARLQEAFRSDAAAERIEQKLDALLRQSDAIAEAVARIGRGG